MDTTKRKDSWLRKLWRAATENLVLKVISVLIALLLFNQVRGGPASVQRVLEVVLTAHTPSRAHKVLLTDLPSTIRVTVRGAPAVVGVLKPEDFGPLEVDLTGAKPTMILEPAMLDVPAGVEIVTLQPANLQLTWDDVIERDLPVHTDLVREGIKPGVKLASAPTLTPATVRMVGGRQVVALLQSVNTEPLLLADLDPGSYVQDLALIKPPIAADFAPGTPARASVAFTLEQEIIERRLEHVPITVLGLEGAIVRPPEVAVVIRGTPQAINALSVPQFVPTVDLSGTLELIRAGARFPVTLGHVPDSVRLVALDPVEVIAIAPAPTAVPASTRPPTAPAPPRTER